MKAIDAHDFEKNIKWYLDTMPYSDETKAAVINIIKLKVNEQPILSVENYSGENRRSRWVIHPKYKFIMCEHCEMRPAKVKGCMDKYIPHKSKYCPYCGCLMEEDKDE